MDKSSRQVIVRDVWKAYGGVPVLKGVNLTFQGGRIHALLGGNGAGKSTLMRLIAGLARCDRGDISIGGKSLSPPSVSLSHGLGLYLVPQEAHLFSNLTVLENVLIGLTGPRAALVAKVGLHLKQLGVKLDLTQEAGTLEIADRQIVEILRGLVRDASFLILDEPTSALTPREAGALFRCMRALAADGVGLIFISHKIREVREICDEISVLRDGSLVLQSSLKEVTDASIVTAMTNTTDGEYVPVRRVEFVANREAILSVERLSGEGFDDISFEVSAGEIVGLAGVVGAGRTELAETIVGIRTASSGRCLLRGAPLSHASPRRCSDRGLAYLPEDRQQNGLFLDAPIAWNMSSSVMHRLPFMLRGKGERRATTNFITQLGIKCQGPGQTARRLSGGNQQKVLIAKCLATKPEILIVDEPTRGVDVLARKDIYELLRRLADDGTAVLIISSDFDEIEQMADRVLIMTHGMMSGSLIGNGVTVNGIAKLAFAAGGG